MKTLWEKWIGKEWVRWVIAGVLGFILSSILWLFNTSFSVGQKVGEHIEGDKQKWEQNDKEHSDIRESVKGLDTKLDSVNTKLSKIDGKVDVLLGNRNVDTGSQKTGYAQK